MGWRLQESALTSDFLGFLQLSLTPFLLLPDLEKWEKEALLRVPSRLGTSQRAMEETVFLW